MKTKQVVLSIIGLCAFMFSALANDNFSDSNDKYKKLAITHVMAKANLVAHLAAPAPTPANAYVLAAAVEAEKLNAVAAPVVENNVLAQNKAEAISMSGLKPFMVDPSLLSKDVVKQLEQFQSQTKALENQIKLDKQLTETK